MNHYVVVYKTSAKGFTKKSLAFVRKQFKQIIKSYGRSSYGSYEDAIEAAKEISKCNYVLHASIVLVQETAMGVWRKGKRS